jgi:hypothetical protein
MAADVLTQGVIVAINFVPTGLLSWPAGITSGGRTWEAVQMVAEVIPVS